MDRRLRRTRAALPAPGAASRNGSPRRSRSPSQSRSKNTIDAGICCGQQLHARSRRMKPQLQRVEIEPAVLGDHDLAIEHAAVRQLRAQRLEQLGKVAVQRFLVAALDQDLVAVAEDQRAKSVPLRFEDPVFACRQFIHALGEHRQHRRVDGKIHASCYNAITRTLLLGTRLRWHQVRSPGNSRPASHSVRTSAAARTRRLHVLRRTLRIRLSARRWLLQSTCSTICDAGGFGGNLRSILFLVVPLHFFAPARFAGVNVTRPRCGRSRAEGSHFRFELVAVFVRGKSFAMSRILVLMYSKLVFNSSAAVCWAA